MVNIGSWDIHRVNINGWLIMVNGGSCWLIMVNEISGWWFQTWLDYFPFHIWVVILPIDELIFFRGVGIPPTSIYVAGSKTTGLQQ